MVCLHKGTCPRRPRVNLTKDYAYYTQRPLHLAQVLSAVSLTATGQRG